MEVKHRRRNDRDWPQDSHAIKSENKFGPEQIKNGIGELFLDVGFLARLIWIWLKRVLNQAWGTVTKHWASSSRQQQGNQAKRRPGRVVKADNPKARLMTFPPSAVEYDVEQTVRSKDDFSFSQCFGRHKDNLWQHQIRKIMAKPTLCA